MHLEADGEVSLILDIRALIMSAMAWSAAFAPQAGAQAAAAQI